MRVSLWPLLDLSNFGTPARLDRLAQAGNALPFCELMTWQYQNNMIMMMAPEIEHLVWTLISQTLRFMSSDIMTCHFMT